MLQARLTKCLMWLSFFIDVWVFWQKIRCISRDQNISYLWLFRPDPFVCSKDQVGWNHECGISSSPWMPAFLYLFDGDVSKFRTSKIPRKLSHVNRRCLVLGYDRFLQFWGWFFSRLFILTGPLTKMILFEMHIFRYCSQRQCKKRISLLLKQGIPSTLKKTLYTIIYML